MTDHDKNETPQPGFASLGVDEKYVSILKKKGIAEPAAIQRAAIPPIADGEDVIVHSGTGTGKTLAYVLPLLQKTDLDSKEMQWLVIVPTQELAMQIVREIDSLAGSGKVAALIGGASLQRQIDKLKSHPPIAVGTPGRLVELLKQRKIKLHRVRHIVIDEVDQVFSLGAAGDMETLLAAVPKERQLLFVTATVTAAVEQTADKWMTDVRFVRGQSQAEATSGVRHEYVVCDRRDKIDLIRRLVRTVNPVSALIFVKETEVIGELEGKLKFAGLQVESLYGDAGKQERASVMRRFASGKLKLLIATDVAARGIDVTRITHVINFEPPADAEQYIHRSGRTGRMGRSGTVVTLTTYGERTHLTKLAAKLGVELREMVLSHGEWRETNAANAAKAEGIRTAQRKPAAKAAPRQQRTDAKRPVKNGLKNDPTAKEKHRKHEQKNKGAPRWLKEKRSGDPK